MHNIIELHKQNVRRYFNKAARTYDAHSSVQQQIGAQLIRLALSYKKRMENVIDLGCGSGLTTECLAREIYFREFHAIDIAEQLLAKARERLDPYGIQTCTADFENWMDHAVRYDIAFSNMALHWGFNFEKTLQNILVNLADTGCMAISLPLERTFNELPCASRNVFFSFAQVKAFIENAGFRILISHAEQISVPFDSQLSALKSIKASGTNYVAASRQMSAGLSAGFKIIKNHPCFLTYHIGYFIAEKIC